MSFAAIELLSDGSENPSIPLAAVLVIRLVDWWADYGAPGRETMLVAATRNAITELTDTVEQAAVASIVNGLADDSAIPSRLLEYGRFILGRNRYATALAIFEAAARVTNEDSRSTVSLDARLGAALCLRTLGRLDDARRVFVEVRRIAGFRSDNARLLRAQLGLATVMRMRGNLPGARNAVARVLRACRRMAVKECEFAALQDLAVIHQQLGELERAVAFATEALPLAARGIEQAQILSNMAAFLVAMGRFESARDALLIQEATTTIEEARTVARNNIIALAAREGDEQTFDRYCGIQRHVALPPLYRVNFLIESARGCCRFDRMDEAAALLIEARNLAEQHNLARSLFEAERALETTNDRPQASETVVLAERELRRMAAALH
jgi:tetratricopeptide (TPR) repeat protein